MFLKNYTIKLAKDVLIRFPKKVGRFFEYIGEFNHFKNQADNRFNVKWSDAYPCLKDKITTTPFDQHYIYHPAWAARILAQTKPEKHVDISSILNFSSIVSAFIPIEFYDYRPAELHLPDWKGGFADLSALPFEDNSIASISCMHTIEHIGLGRYGDRLDATGDITAINELKRVTRLNGDILFVTPVGKTKIEFNAHRIYSFELIIELFKGCQLVEFSLIPDSGGIITNADPRLIMQQLYGCGCFWFKKR